MNILNDKRLLACAALVKGKVTADIGTDHGYLPAYLVSTGRCERCIAADINEKPLAQAERTARECGLEEKIEVILSDGLKNVPLSGVSDIIIAGMGGELIAKILEDCETVRNINSAFNLVLQPMTRPTALREYLYDNGFVIETEQCVREGRFVYSVMSAFFSGKTPDYLKDERYRYLGRVDLKTDMGRAYAEDRIKKLTAAADGMLKSERTRTEGEKQLALAQRLREVLKYETGNK